MSKTNNLSLLAPSCSSLSLSVSLLPFSSHSFILCVCVCVAITTLGGLTPLACTQMGDNNKHSLYNTVAQPNGHRTIGVGVLFIKRYAKL